MTKKEYINKRFDAGRTICRAGKRYIIKYAPTNAGISREVIDFMDFSQIVKKEKNYTPNGNESIIKEFFTNTIK